MTDTYTTIVGSSEAVFTEKRSRFLAFAHHVEDEDTAKSIVAEYKKKYYDARHVCYAWVLGFDGETTRVNDDGEPSGTAGKPILGIIRSKGLTRCVVIVVRYFGGIKLGTPGLIAAYKEAAVLALDAAQTQECIVTTRLAFEIPYTEADLAMRWVRDAGGQLLSPEYTAEGMVLTAEIRTGEADKLRQRLSQIHTLRWQDNDNDE